MSLRSHLRSPPPRKSSAIRPAALTDAARTVVFQRVRVWVSVCYYYYLGGAVEIAVAHATVGDLDEDVLGSERSSPEEGRDRGGVRRGRRGGVGDAVVVTGEDAVGVEEGGAGGADEVGKVGEGEGATRWGDAGRGLGQGQGQGQGGGRRHCRVMLRVMTYVLQRWGGAVIISVFFVGWGREMGILLGNTEGNGARDVEVGGFV